MFSKLSGPLVVCGLVASIGAMAPSRAFAQGCVMARLTAPSCGVQSTTYQTPGEWQLTIAYRYFHSFRDFQGSKELPVPSPPELLASTHVNAFDVSVTRAVTRRFAFTVALPFQDGRRETFFEHDGVHEHTMHAIGIGDAKITGSYWLLDPSRHRNGNVSIGGGVKMPTGRSAAEDTSFRVSGPVERPVDPAIQPGDGGWGIIVTGQSFAKASPNITLFAHGSYLINPREMNTTESPFGDLPDFTFGDVGYIIDSVPDQYVARAGVMATVGPAKNVSISLAGRIDGVPATDLVGGSDGYRLPGYSIALEPGVSMLRHRNSFTLTVPIAVKRHGSYTLADKRTGNPIGGTAALADYAITVSYSRRF